MPILYVDNKAIEPTLILAGLYAKQPSVTTL